MLIDTSIAFFTFFLFRHGKSLSFQINLRIINAASNKRFFYEKIYFPQFDYFDAVFI